MSVVTKSTNTIAPIVSRIQLFEDTMTNTSKRPWFTRDGREKDHECSKVLHSWLATSCANDWGCVTAELLHPTDHENASASCTHDDSDMSFKFTFSILSFLMLHIVIIIRSHQSMIERYRAS